MNSELHKYLVEVDELGNWEFPKDGRWDTPFKEIKAVKENIENIIGSSLDLDSNVQDASFLTDLGILDERYKEWEKGTQKVWAQKFHKQSVSNEDASMIDIGRYIRNNHYKHKDKWGEETAEFIESLHKQWDLSH